MGYDKSFYERFTAMHVPAARRVMQEFAHLAQPQSAIDIGCGDGSFLSILPEFGLVDCLGVEGPWIGEEQLQIPASQVLRRDLDQPFRVERRYDLAISIEVAEHLRPERAQTLVDDLTRLADLVLFSAAIPGQGGAHHINERWQSYWAGLFGERGYQVIDSLRPALWGNSEIPVPWRQNLLIYANDRALERWPSLLEARRRSAGQILDVVHPLAFWRARKPRGVGYLLTRQAPAGLRHTIRRPGPHGEQGRRHAALSALRILNRSLRSG
jgi:Methyltransferase domain